MSFDEYLGGQLGLDAVFAADRAAAWMGPLLEQTPWRQPRVRLFGREVRSPRLACWYGDPDAVYTYSGQRNEPRPWTPLLAGIRERVERASGARFNSVLLNYYRDGEDRMGWHSDDEPELGDAPLVASLSLGSTRVLRLAHRRRRWMRCELRLSGGSLLLMRPPLQADWRHCVPSAGSVRAPRVNLTFRQVVA